MYEVHNGWDTGESVLFDDLNEARAFLITESKRIRKQRTDHDFSASSSVFLSEVKTGSIDHDLLESDQNFPFEEEDWHAEDYLTDPKLGDKVAKAQALSDKIAEQEAKYEARMQRMESRCDSAAAEIKEELQATEQTGSSRKRKRRVDLSLELAQPPGAEKRPKVRVGTYMLSNESDVDAMYKMLGDFVKSMGNLDWNGAVSQS